MAYLIEPVSREYLPEGKDWMLVEEPDGGDIIFVIACDAGPIEMTPELCDTIADRVYAHLMVLPQEPRDYVRLMTG